MSKPISPIEKLIAGDPSCFGSHRKEMGEILEDYMRVKKYCDQFTGSPYHVTMMKRCMGTLDNEIRRHITDKKLMEVGCK